MLLGATRPLAQQPAASAPGREGGDESDLIVFAGLPATTGARGAGRTVASSWWGGGPMRAPRGAVCIVALLASLLGGRPLAAQQRVYLPDRIGSWRRSSDLPEGEPRADAAEVRALRTTLDRIEQILRATPMLSPPRGFDVRTWQRLDGGCAAEPSACRRTALGGWITFAFEDYSLEDGKVVTHTIEPPRFEIALNDPLSTHVLHQFGSPELLDAEGNEIFGKVVEVDRVGGFALHDNGVVILARDDRPVFVPATREEFLRAAIAGYSGVVGGALVTEPLERELAALPPAERRSQAFTHIDSEATSLLVPETRAGATPMFKFNPGYFDETLPRTAVQLVTVRFSDFDNFNPPLAGNPDLATGGIPLTASRLSALEEAGVGVDQYRIYELLKLLSYSALAALMAVPAR